MQIDGERLFVADVLLSPAAALRLSTRSCSVLHRNDLNRLLTSLFIFSEHPNRRFLLLVNLTPKYQLGNRASDVRCCDLVRLTSTRTSDIY